MAEIKLRPDLKTAGGEINDVLLNGRYVGKLILVYRDADRLAGSLQLDQDVLSDTQLHDVTAYVQDYILALSSAIQATQCQVVLTYVDGNSTSMLPLEEMVEEIDQQEWINYGPRFEDEDAAERDEIAMNVFDLVIVSESSTRVNYQVFDEDQQLAAEAVVKVNNGHIHGTVEWITSPNPEDWTSVADLIADDFEESEIESFTIEMLFAGQLMDTVQWSPQGHKEKSWIIPRDDSPYVAVLSRDDGDVLTYDLYHRDQDVLPLGTATVDISRRELTGFIDFREPGSLDDREEMVAVLLHELDKEKQYHSINLSMMHRNQLMEEVLLETDSFH